MKQALWPVAIALLFTAPLTAQDALSIDSEGRIWVTIHGTEPLLLETVVVPVGTINAYGGTTDPADGGWLICDGRALSSTDYPKLFAVIGTSFGDGSIDRDGNAPTPHPHGLQYDFNLPDMRGRFARGLDTTGQHRDPDSALRTNIQGDPQDGVGGIQDDALQEHSHWYRTSSSPASSGGSPYFQAATGAHRIAVPNPIDIGGPITHGTNGDARVSSETRPDNVAVNYIIKHGEAN